METILRCKEMAEIMLLPIRHHSPACSIQIKKVIEKWKPSSILVEGPENANSLREIMVHGETKAPFAIYYSYHDKGGKLSKEKAHYKCYYPFLEYSPELTALREAAGRGIEAAFIDLPYGDILAASKEGKGLLKEEEKNNYNDDYLLSGNAYIKRLCEKTGLRSFDEFWEKYFEINGLYEESDIWFSHLMTYCCLARKSTSTESMEGDGCLEREAHMAAKIVQCAMFHGMKGEKEGQWEENLMAWMEPYRILVITGGFHMPGIRERLSGSGWEETKRLLDSKTVRIPREYQSVYLMPYSMEAADALNGYASGMPFAGFYQKVWEGSGETETPYEKAVLDMLVTVGKEVRKKEGYLSTYDEICAWQMAQGLGELRGKPQPGAFELWDAVLASYVKGEYNISSAMPMMILKKQMIGRGVGSLCPLADVPPILHDFEAKCKNFGLKVCAASETETILSIFSSKKHRNESMFFHQTVFVGTSFARRVKGPNLQLGKDKNLIRETWKYKWSAEVPAALIDVSVHGATVEEASASLVKEQLKEDIGAGRAAVLLTQVFEMGLSGQLETVYERVYELMARDTDFYSIAEAVKALMMMEELSGLYGSKLEIARLMHEGVRKLIGLLPSMAGIKEENLSSCMETVKLLYQVTGKDSSADGEKEAYYEALDKMCKNREINAGLHGCIHGILYGSQRESAQAVEGACLGYLTGTREQLLQTAVFFRGLFYTAKDLIFVVGKILEMLDDFFGRVEEKEFMELLPQLRMAFAYFTPGETDKIAMRAAKLHGKGQENILLRKEIMPEWYAYGQELDAYARGHMA